MKYVARKQIYDLFLSPENTLSHGLWFSGYEEEGEYREWYKNGQLSEVAFFKNGIAHGECKLWDKDGNLTNHWLFDNGEVVRDYLE